MQNKIHAQDIPRYNTPGHLIISNYTGPLSGFSSNMDGVLTQIRVQIVCIQTQIIII